MIGDLDSSQIEYFDSMNNIFKYSMSNFHTTTILFLKYLSNGYVASSSLYNPVNIWDPHTWTSIRQYKMHSDDVNCIDQINEDTIVSGSRDKSIHIWSINTGETINKINVIN